IPPPEVFAVGPIRPLTAMQFGISHRLASHPGRLSGSDRDKDLEALEKEVLKNFDQLIERPREDMQIGVSESLKLSNDPALLKLTADQLVPVLLQIKERKQLIEEAFWTVLSRPPTPQEHEHVDRYLEQRKENVAEALRQAVWALFNSPEFRFNH